MAYGDGGVHETAGTSQENSVNTLPLHPAVVHVPLGLALIMPALFAGLLWAVVTNRLPGRAWLVALALQAVLLGAAGVALVTGAQQEETAEARAGEAAIEAHARAGQAFTALAGATLAVAAVAFMVRNRRGPFVTLAATSIAMGLAVLVVGIRAGHQGGSLVHGGGPAVAVPGNDPADRGESAGTMEAEAEDDDD